MTQSKTNPAPAAFLDRDDTLIPTSHLAPTGDLADPRRLTATIPGAAAALGRLRAAGYRLVLITNQGGVARGRYTEADVTAFHRHLDRLLLDEGLTPNDQGRALDAARYCPYHPKGTVTAYAREHPWRKPAPGMLLDAAAALHLDLARSLLLGDAPRDAHAAAAAGIPPHRCCLVTTDPATIADADANHYRHAPTVTAATDLLLTPADPRPPRQPAPPHRPRP